MMCWASFSEDALSETSLADFPPVVSNRTRSFSYLALAGVWGGCRAKQISKCSWTNSRVCGLRSSVLWTCLNYLQIVVQDKVIASQQLYVGQDVPEPKVILPWFLCCEIPVLPAVSLCSPYGPCSVCSCPSAPALTLAHPCTSASQLMALPSRQPWRMQWECRRRKNFLTFLVLSWANSHCLLVASNCCSLQVINVVSSVASVQPPDTSAEENLAHCMELQFMLNMWHHVFSCLTIARTVNRSVGKWVKILSLQAWSCAAVLTLQSPGLKARSSSENRLEKPLSDCVLLETWLDPVSQGMLAPTAPIVWIISGTCKSFGKLYYVYFSKFLCASRHQLFVFWN